MNLAKIFKAAITVAKANPTVVVSAISAIGPVVKAVKKEIASASPHSNSSP